MHKTAQRWLKAVVCRHVQRAQYVVAHFKWHDDARWGAIIIYVVQQTSFDNESILNVEILLMRGVEFDLIGVWFAIGVDTAHHSSYCGVCALLVEPVGPLFETIGVGDGAKKHDSDICELSRHDLVDGLACETRLHVNNRVFGAFDVLYDDRVLEQRRNSAINARAGFGFFWE